MAVSGLTEGRSVSCGSLTLVFLCLTTPSGRLQEMVASIPYYINIYTYRCTAFLQVFVSLPFFFEGTFETFFEDLSELTCFVHIFKHGPLL